MGHRPHHHLRAAVLSPVISLRLPAPDDAAEIVACLLLGADHAAEHAPDLAARRRQLADAIGDALDALPAPTTQQ